MIASIRPVHRQSGGRREELVSGPAGAGVDRARSDLRQIAELRGDRQARESAAVKGRPPPAPRGLDLDAGGSAHECQGALEHGHIADHQRPGQIMQSRLEPAANDHLGPDARDVAHRQADQRTSRFAHASLPGSDTGASTP